MKARNEEAPASQQGPQTNPTTTDTVAESESEGFHEPYAECCWPGHASTTHATFMGRIQRNISLIDKHGSWFLLDLEYRRRLREGA